MIELAWVAYVAFSHNLRQVEPHEAALEERSENSNVAQHLGGSHACSFPTMQEFPW